jgi:prevent-host-death family protein
MWSAQDAKNRFGEFLLAAGKSPQIVTKHGHEEAVLVSANEYRRLKTVEQTKKMTFAEMLLAIPKAPDDEEEDIFPRMTSKLRDAEL